MKGQSAMKRGEMTLVPHGENAVDRAIELCSMHWRDGIGLAIGVPPEDPHGAMVVITVGAQSVALTVPQARAFTAAAKVACQTAPDHPIAQIIPELIASINWMVALITAQPAGAVH